ncbi:MAG: DUF1254 domain-containing protein [Alphaproteobacteria bacterium]|nr:DUF1254 domain-containing protein [Alphaproteobacteria bacterium]
MTRLLVAAALFVASAIAGHIATIAATPGFIMGRVMGGVAARAGDWNRMVHAPPPSPDARTIVRPSPDLLYSICAYDLADGPVAIETGATEGYFSISFYDGATNNFRTENDDTLDADRASMTIVRAGDAAPTGTTTVRSPSERGVALIRRRISTPDRIAAALASQAGDACGPANRG